MPSMRSCRLHQPSAENTTVRGSQYEVLLVAFQQEKNRRRVFLIEHPRTANQVKRLVFWALDCESNCELIASLTLFLAVRKATSALRDEFVELLPLAKPNP